MTGHDPQKHLTIFLVGWPTCEMAAGPLVRIDKYGILVLIGGFFEASPICRRGQAGLADKNGNEPGSQSGQLLPLI